MKTTRIYLVRHGETEWNVEKRMQGQKDSPLTSRGRDQAVLLREKLLADPVIAKRGLDLAISSALGRACQTLEICINGINITKGIDAGLNEISLGEWEGLTFSEVKQKWPEEFYNFWHCPSLYTPSRGGETYMQLQARMVSTLKKIAAIMTKPANILVISHWIAIKTALVALQGLSIDHIPSIPKPANGEFQIITL